MAEVVTIELSKLPPSTNALWRVAAGGRGYKSKRYVDWCSLADGELTKQRPAKIAGPYALQLRFVRPDKRMRDIDNLIKPLNDALARSRVIEADHYCRRIEAEWVSEGPAVWARVIAKREAA